MKPWLKWYPTDWRADPSLRTCSLSARGLWIEMLGYMHEATPAGFLLIAGRVPTTQMLASLVGSDVKTVGKALVELEQAQVFSLDDQGRMFSRRMLRDIDKEETDRMNGRGGGNPHIRVNGGVNPPLEPTVNGGDKAQKPEARVNPPPPTVVPPPSNRGTRLDASWKLPRAWGEWALRKRPEWDDNTVRLVADQFRNHWVAKTGRDATKLDWEATWQNWVISPRSDEMTKRSKAATRSTGVQL
jgi:hypothetical protein